MRIPLALLTLLHERTQTVAGIAGVSFAAVLMFTQLGFYGAVLASATLIYDHLDFDVLLTSPEYVRISRAGAFPVERLYMAESIPGVLSATPCHTGFRYWRNTANHERRPVLVIGVDPARIPLRLPELDAYRNRLQEPDTVLFDRQSRGEFGSHKTGVRAELGSRLVEVVGEFTMGTGFGVRGTVLTSDQNFSRLFGSTNVNHVSLGLLNLHPGADPAEVAQRLRDSLPSDVRVLTRDEALRGERRHWVRSTSTGNMFGFGVLVAAVVGAAIVYQVLSSHIINHEAEYATLKAIGFAPSRLSVIVLQQSLLMSLVSFPLALVVSIGVYRVAQRGANIPIYMEPSRIITVFLLSSVACIVAGLFALRHVHVADPADLY